METQEYQYEAERTQMEIAKLIKKLKTYNEWRRGAKTEQPEPNEVGKMIDDTIKVIEKLEQDKHTKDEAIRESLIRFHNYEMQCDDDAPPHHRNFKRMLKNALAL